MNRHFHGSVSGLFLTAIIAACGGEDGGGPTGPPPPPTPVVTTVEIDPPAGPFVSFDESLRLRAVVKDQNGNTIANPAVAWALLDPGAVVVNPDGTVIAVANGSARVTATASRIADTITVVVDQQVAEIKIFPENAVLELPGDTLNVAGRAVDALGNTVEGAGSATWSANGAISVDPATGVVEALGFGGGNLTATLDGVSSTTVVQVIGDRFFLSNGIQIRYELDEPSGAGPFPAIIWVHGSGMLDRNSQKGATDPLVPEGLAVLRYDKRGVGQSGGNFVEAGPGNGVLDVLAGDAENAIRFLARLPQIDTTRIGIMGNSQAGWIVPKTAVRAPDLVNYIMLWSGPTVSIGLEIFYSGLASNPSTPLDDVYAQLGSFNGNPGYDALADISSLDIPGLWQFGALDRSIPTRLDVERLDILIDAGKPFRVVEWEFGDHALRDTRVGQFYDVWSEYLLFMRDHGILPAAP